MAENEPSILALNCGSSSVKFALIRPKSGERPLEGQVAGLGGEQARLRWRWKGQDNSAQTPGCALEQALEELANLLGRLGVDSNAILGVGHRVVHGGEHFTRACLITPEVEKKIEACVPLAPLHNPANLAGVQGMRRLFPEKPQAAVFDTAFHQTMPPKAYLYAVPYRYYEELHVRRYGFHGTSHRYVAQETARRLGRPSTELCAITAHLGNGCSACAVRRGQSVDTTMGLTPLEGLVMGTRSGDVDPNLHSFLAEQEGLSLDQVTEILNRRSGLLGLSGVDSDLRGVEQAARDGDERARIALEVFCYRLAKQIAGLAAALPELNALAFTGGIGENSSRVREEVCRQLTFLGVRLNAERNQDNGSASQGLISESENRCPSVWVIPTDEELMIAREAFELMNSPENTN